MKSRELFLTALAGSGIALHLALRLGGVGPGYAALPLYAVLLFAGAPLASRILRRVLARDFGSDLLAGIAIAVSAGMGQPLVSAILVLMLSGGAALERFAAGRASAVLRALARRMPRTAHRRKGVQIEDARLEDVQVGDVLVVLAHEICPADGVVLEGRSQMNEAYLTGEPYEISKVPGSSVLSGAVNGSWALTIRAQKLPADSRYAGIVRVLEAADKNRPRLRRLGDAIAAWYAPLALALAFAAWWASADPVRFLAVLVVATPCPLLIAIPVSVIGAVSLAARGGIIVKNPAALEQITNCRTVIFDKTGTLTCGKPALTKIACAPSVSRQEALRLAASLEQYSRHPLAPAILKAASEEGLLLAEAGEVSEEPGRGLFGVVDGRRVRITGRSSLAGEDGPLPAQAPGLECLLLLEGRFAAAFHFRDEPRQESHPFLRHLSPSHQVTKLLMVSGDRESEARYLADTVGITLVEAGKSPEEKVEIVTRETRQAKTLFVGDGINDAPALRAATVGVAIGSNSDVTSEAADAVVLTPSIGKVDELIHIGRRMRAIALQSAVGGMALSLIGMLAAATGHLPPLEGAVAQEIIDLAAVLNALRAAVTPARLTDF